MSTVQIIVHHRGDTYLARAGRGKDAKLASSTSDGIYAAEAAARKFFGKRAYVTLRRAQIGDICARVPSIYYAIKERAAR